ncbi:recombinase family protein [Amycolatopsis sp.]|jgi:hypothetical protein|uniref:recombinase family protein n=1 Tax=Amycolatopsis sp. TaxID=37632 RepID=UPI002E00174F|nr:recombinase family protein [Amycolatopsis sp.]
MKFPRSGHKAAEGFRLRVLVTEDESADVVLRIFAEYLEGNGDRAIAKGLNQDRVPCPSERRPDQNRHRLADGWQGSTVRSILENPRYTGTPSSGDGPRTRCVRGAPGPRGRAHPLPAPGTRLFHCLSLPPDKLGRFLHDSTRR